MGNSSETITIDFTHTVCSYTSVNYSLGWKCNGYPSFTDGFNCVDESGTLNINPQNPAFETFVTQQPPATVDLCTSFEIEILARNTGLGDAVNQTLTTILPIGGSAVQYVTGSSMLTYNGSTTTIADPTISGDEFTWNVGGSVGNLAGVPDVNNFYKIKFSIEANCGFFSGSVLKAEATGDNLCGTTYKSQAQQINPIVITGASPADLNYTTTLDGSGNPWFSNIASTFNYQVSIDFNDLETLILVAPS